VRRAGLVVIAALAWVGAAGAADARLRGEATSSVRGLGAGMPWRPAPAVPRPPAPAPPAPSPTPTPAPTPAPSLPRAVQARTYDRDEERLQLTLSRQAVAAGEVRVEFNNALAEDPHDLRVERVDGTGEPFSFDVLGPGAVAARRLALGPGDWRLSCTLFGHAERGMRAVLRVEPVVRVHASVRRRG
jgi:hypothetical protein